MRVAVCISGQPRNWHVSRQQQIKDRLAEFDEVDFYGHAWDYEPEGFAGVLKVTNQKQDFQQIFDRMIAMSQYWRFVYYKDKSEFIHNVSYEQLFDATCAAYGQHLSAWKCFNVIIHKYDVALRIRWDTSPTPEGRLLHKEVQSQEAKIGWYGPRNTLYDHCMWLNSKAVNKFAGEDFAKQIIQVNLQHGGRIDSHKLWMRLLGFAHWDIAHSTEVPFRIKR